MRLTNEAPGVWDGLSDRLRGVLARLHGSHAVLVWTHAERLMRRSMGDLLMAVVVLSDLAVAVSSTATGFPRVVRFSVVLVGDDPAFHDRW